MEEEWDHLVVLDGCRYDYFSKMYGAYMEGRLEMGLSLGSNTVEWRDNSFPECYGDVVYVSANPYINSRVSVKGFKAWDHFHRVVDVWDWGWDAELGTVHPRKVNEAARIALEEYPDKRLIIHYLQPHCPYVGLQPKGTGYPSQSPASSTVLDGTLSAQKLPTIRRRALGLTTSLAKSTLLGRVRVVTEGHLWRLRESLGLPPETPMDAVRRTGGVAGLREAYARNLELVLTYASELLRGLDGNVAVTADHGELLGESGRFSHGYGREESLLLEVPWFRPDRGSVF